MIRTKRKPSHRAWMLDTISEYLVEQVLDIEGMDDALVDYDHGKLVLCDPKVKYTITVKAEKRPGRRPGKE